MFSLLNAAPGQRGPVLWLWGHFSGASQWRLCHSEGVYLKMRREATSMWRKSDSPPSTPHPEAASLGHHRERERERRWGEEEPRTTGAVPVAVPAWVLQWRAAQGSCSEFRHLLQQSESLPSERFEDRIGKRGLCLSEGIWSGALGAAGWPEEKQ